MYIHIIHGSIIIIALISLSNQQSILDSIIKLLREEEEQNNSEPPDVPMESMLTEYDFIVIGAGTAGCVVANRLSENPNWNVLLVEAGRSEDYLMDFPMVVHYLQLTETNWKYQTEPSNQACLGFDKKRCNWPRGKVVGGSSVLNYMIYTRGNRRDFDNWAKLGNTGWSYADVLPYFKKIENFTIPELYNPIYHGKDGYLGVSYAPYHTKIADAVVNSSMQYGMPYVDYNGATQIGVSYLQLSLRNGVRESSSRAYLHPIKQRSNLHLSKLSMVTKIVIDPETKQVQGIEMMKNGRRHFVRVKKEVISSAGAINSPQLLMLSGIGPKRHLGKHDIPVLSNLRVGYNLMDHIAIGGVTFVINETVSLKPSRVMAFQNINDYINNNQGPISIPGGCEVLSFHDLDHPNNPDGYPNIELLYQGGSIVSDLAFRKVFGITDAIYNTVYKPIEKKDTFMVFPMLLRPKSRGRIVLKNNKYNTRPSIFPNYFADPKDMETIIKGVKLALEISKQPALQAMGAKLHAIPLPECANRTFGSDEYFECMARYLTFTIYHQSGTCKMGPITDKEAVVDPRLKVYGIKGLRVIDASIMPEIIAAHTNSPTFMIAEKGSDMIKEDWAK